ncbi:MAG: DUF4097 family beta strand repeat protein [Candidatus Eremiobacteraeota bacterium]|nr:DUF4097 family beta strand repeat protein [Candidatus Eremiobacteraeota bacterium]
MKRIRVTAVSSRGLRLLLLPALLVLASCGNHQFTVTHTGRFDGRTMNVLNEHGTIYAYGPAFGQPPNQYTVSQVSTFKNARTNIKITQSDLTICPAALRQPPQGACLKSPTPPIDYTVRVPKQAHLSLFTANGSIHATDVTQPVDARVRTGEIKIQIPSYANAATEEGNITVLFGDAQWPGTLHFSTERGDIEVWVPATADADVNLHTDHGTIFTDFNLRGTSSGDTETIAGSIGRGGNRKVDVHVTNGSIRMLKLTPQM